MLRKIMAVVIGIIAGGLVVTIGEMASHMIYPLPPGKDMGDPAVIREYIMALPVMAHVLVLLAWGLGAFASGVFSSLIMRSSSAVYAIICGTFMLGMSIYTMLEMQHPAWFWVPGVLVHVPCAWLGYRFIKSRKLA